MDHTRGALRPALIAIAAMVALTAALLSSAAASDDDPSAGELRQQGRVVRELPELRTATSRTFATDARTNVTRVYTDPVNYRSGGAWKLIDNDLQADPASGYALENSANGYDLSLPDSLDAKPVEVKTGSDSLRFALDGAAGAPEADGSEARYADALPGVDVTYEAQNNAVKESLVLASAAAGSKYSFHVEASEGLSARANDAGGIDFVRDGKVRMSFAPPFMEDARGARSDEVSYDLRADGSGYALVLRADPEWLADPDRAYPVALDPTTVVHTNDDCYMVSGSDANTGFCGYTDPYIQLGLDGNGNQRRAFMRVDTSAIPKRAEVLEGELKLNVESGTQRAVSLYRATRDSTSARTWNKYDGTNAWTTPGGDISSSPDGSNATFGATTGINDIEARKLVQGWVDGSIPNYGMVVKDNGSTAGVLTLTGDAASNDPVLEVEWAHRTGEQSRWTFASQQLSDRMTLKTNVANGNLILSENDISIPGIAGHDLSFKRSFNNLELDTSSSTDDLGKYWRSDSGWDVWLRSSGNGSTQNLNGPGDFWAPYDKNADGSYTTPTGMNADLVKNADGTHTLTYRSQNRKLKFSAAGDLLTDKDRNDNTILFNYAGPGSKLSSIKDSHDQGGSDTLSVSYTAAGYIDKITDRTTPTVRTWDYNYTGQFLTSYVNPDGKTTSYSYDASDNLYEITDPRGYKTRMLYDSSNRVTSIQRDVAGAGPITRYEYPTTLSSQCSGVGSGEGAVVGESIERDPLWPGGTSTAHTTKYCWDKLLRVQKTFDGRGKARSKDYSGNSDVKTITSAGAQSWKLGYDTDDRAKDAEAPSASGPTGMKQSFGYDTTVTDKSNQAFWLQKSMTDERGNTTNYGRDAKGNVTDVNLPLATQNNIHLTVNSDGTTASIRDARATGTTAFGYTGGDLTSIDRQNTTGGQTQLGTETFTYDALHRVKTALDGAAQTSTFTYDPLDRQTNIAFSGSRGSANVAYGFDYNGNLTSRVDSTGTSTYTYDALNRLTQEALPAGTTTYTYDAAGNLKTLVDAGGTTTYNYGDSNLLDSMQAPGDSAATTFTYTDDDARKTTSYPNGVVISANWEDGSSSNTGPGRLKSIVTKKGTTTLASFSYGYTPSAGCAQGSADTTLRQSMTTPAGTANYCYDALGRLTSATNHNAKNYTYTLDGNGNITKAVRDGATTSFGYNEADELCWSVGSSQASAACSPAPTGATTYSSDAEGNLTTSSAAFAASYNVREQATSMTSLSGTSSTALAYSGPNQAERISAGSTTFLNNALGVGAETASSATTRYRRDNEGGLVSERLSSNAIHYYAFDGLGSVAGLTDSAGAMGTSYTYDPYGATSSSGTTPNPWRYAATYQDPTGFYKMGLRYYSPSLMRWSQPDPQEQLTDALQAMRFGYAGGDPVNGVDPNGMNFLSDAGNWVNRRARTVQNAWNHVKAFGRTKGGACVIGGAIGAGFGAYVGRSWITTAAGAGAGCAMGVFHRTP